MIAEQHNTEVLLDKKNKAISNILNILRKNRESCFIEIDNNSISQAYKSRLRGKCQALSLAISLIENKLITKNE
jgi:hypothetical protein